MTINASKVDGKVDFVASTVVFLAELGKLIACLVWMCFIKGNTDKFSLCSSFKYSVPALLYALENNVIFVIYQYLKVANASVLWNLKIIIVAFLFRFCLKRILSTLQWLSVVLLLLGVVTSQAEHLSLANLAHVCNATVALPATDAGAEDLEEDYSAGLGILGVTVLLSSCAGIYNEWIMKRKSESDNSIALQGVYLYLWGVVINAVLMVAKDREILTQCGFFCNYNHYTVAVLGLHVVTGLSVMCVFKFLDNMSLVFSHILQLIIVTNFSIIWCATTTHTTPTSHTHT